MKKIISGLKDLISRHKILSMICLLALVIIVILLYVFCSIFVGGSNKYGHRLDGIKEVEISTKEMKNLSKDLEKNAEVDSADVRIQGKIIYIDIMYTKDVSQDKAKEIAASTLDNFGKEEKEFYDFEYILTQVIEEDGTDNGFKITGTKGPKTEGISFIKS